MLDSAVSHVWVSAGRIHSSLNSCIFTELSGHVGTRSNYSCLSSAVHANQNSQGLGTLAPCYLFVCTYCNPYKRGINSFPLPSHPFFKIFFNNSALTIHSFQHLYLLSFEFLALGIITGLKQPQYSPLQPL